MRTILGIGILLGATAAGFGQSTSSLAVATDSISTAGLALVKRADGTSVQPALRGSQFEAVQSDY